MNPETYIRKELEKNIIHGQTRARKRQRKIISATLKAYRRGQYNEIDDLMADAKKAVEELSVIGGGITAKKFAKKMNVSKSTARRHLLTLDGIVRNESKRPFIYKVGKS